MSFSNAERVSQKCDPGRSIFNSGILRFHTFMKVLKEKGKTGFIVDHYDVFRQLSILQEAPMSFCLILVNQGL